MLAPVLSRDVDAEDQAHWYTSHTLNGGASCNVEVSASGLVAFEGTFNVFVDVSWSCSVPNDYVYIHTFGKKGTARLETLFGFSPNGKRPEYPLHIWTNGQSGFQAIAGSVDPFQAYQEQWRFFVESILTDKPLSDLVQDNLATVQIIEALYQSAVQQDM